MAKPKKHVNRSRKGYKKKNKDKQHPSTLAQKTNQPNQLNQPSQATPSPQPRPYQPSMQVSPENRTLLEKDEFHNPYHFVPAKTPDLKHWLSTADFSRGRLGRHTHARYLTTIDDQPLFNGRLICRLTTEDYVFIGAGQDKQQDTSPVTLKPFELIDHQPALPATSLRGLLSSLAETASNSALRVLTDSMLSYRQSTQGQEALSALGMIVEKPDADEGIKYFLRPLTLPKLARNRREQYTLDSNYQRLFPDASPWSRLKVYINDPGYDSYPATGYFYMKLNADWSAHGNRQQISHNSHLRCPSSSQGRFLIGQKPLNDDYTLLNEAQWQDVCAQNPNAHYTYTRGILRILGRSDTRPDMPDTKKHELFIPYTEQHEKTPLIPISSRAIDRLHALTDQRTAHTKNRETYPEPHPYQPRGTSRNTNIDDLKDKLRIKNGDIVYFKLSDNAGKTADEVAEIAFSSIWRSEVENTNRQAAGVHAFFNSISSELLPFNQHRKAISPAELLFGFVADDRSEKALALAGRVNVSCAQLWPNNDPQPYAPYRFTSKVLDSPKPPSPAFYFTPRDDKAAEKNKGYIAKAELSPNQHRPQGRKYYLHPHPDQENPWQTHQPDEQQSQKVQFSPIDSGKEFYFHLDFSNLSEWELGLLCYVLRPTDAFRHKLGLAKGLGMGKVRIDPVGLFCLDRQKRYRTTDPFSANRYHHYWTDGSVAQWPTDYERERNEHKNLNTLDCWQHYRQIFTETMDKDIRTALELLGDPASSEFAVHTPQIQSHQPNDLSQYEDETFKWFVANDSGSGSQANKLAPAKTALKPISRHKLDPNAQSKLPTLVKHRYGD